MSLLHLDGFDGASSTTGTGSNTETETYLGDRYTTPAFTGTNDPSVFTGWGGVGKAVSFGETTTADNNYIRKDLAEVGTVFTGFAIRPHKGATINTPGSQYTVVTFRHDTDNTDHVVIRVIDGRHLKITRSSSNFLGSVYNAFVPGRWHYIEFKITISNTVGVVNIRIDDQEVLNLTNVDTRQGGAGDDLDTIELRGINGVSGVPAAGIGQTLFDDWYIVDNVGSAPNNTFLGPIKIEEINPDAAGDNSDFTPLASTNVSNVDETPSDGDTTYNESSTSTHLDLFNADSLVDIDGTIFGVVVDSEARLTDGTGFNIINTVKSSTTEGAGTSTAIAGTSYEVILDVFEQDPNATAAWTVTTVNAMQIGYEVG